MKTQVYYQIYLNNGAVRRFGYQINNFEQYLKNKKKKWKALGYTTKKSMRTVHHYEDYKIEIYNNYKNGKLVFCLIREI